MTLELTYPVLLFVDTFFRTYIHEHCESVLLLPLNPLAELKLLIHTTGRNQGLNAFRIVGTIYCIRQVLEMGTKSQSLLEKAKVQ